MTLGSLDSSLFAAVFAIILLGGLVKGALGIGLPAVSMSLLPLFIEPTLAVTILAVPIILTNGQQILSVTGWPSVVRRFWVAGISVFISVSVVSMFLDEVPIRAIGIVVGLSLISFAVFSLMDIRLPVTMAPGWQLLTGILTGITGGLTAVKTPVAIYCAALSLPREEFVAASGFMFFMGGLGLSLGLSSSKLLNPNTLPLSAIAVVVAVIGFQLGAYLRRGIDAVLFRKLLLGAMLVLRMRMTLVNVF